MRPFDPERPVPGLLRRLIPRRKGPFGRRKGIFLVLLALYFLVLAFNRLKPLPAGVSVAGPWRDASAMEMLHDLTFQRDGQPVAEQQIFQRVFSMIDSAEIFVVLDMFFFNDEHGGERAYRPLSGELTRHLVARKEEVPALSVVFITDEINNFYGAYTSPEIRQLEASGVRVVITRMTHLRDSNPGYSAAWRILVGWMSTGGPGWLPHPFSSTGRKVTARSYLKALNFKANHRKLLVTEQGCLVASANPHDASSFHSNIAFAGTSGICQDLLRSERAVAAFSGASVVRWPVFRTPVGEGGTDAGASVDSGPTGQGRVQLVTEGKILRALLQDLDAAAEGDRIDLAMFYLSHRRVLGALLDAAERGAEVRVVLDPNKDAFGREKGGIPNRQMARELVRRSGGRIAVRWFDTRGEQFHTKMVRVARDDVVVLMGGSANLTRRNISDYNLEADLRFELHPNSSLARESGSYFERIFENRDGTFTLPFEAYRDDSLWKRILYRVQERTGISSF